MSFSVSNNPFNAESVKELKVSHNDAKAITKDNGLDEVFYKMDNKEFVAFGKEMNLKGVVPGATIKIGDKQATITHVDDETTGFWEGAKHDVTSTPGLIIEGGFATLGMVTGATEGLAGAVFGLETLKDVAAFGGSFALGSAIVVTGLVGIVGAAKGMFNGPNYDTINVIAK